MHILSVLPEFDWVIGVMPSTESTLGFFDESFFSAMKETGSFVNVGRGSAVVEPDLIRALQQGRIAGAMLDVFENEPLEPDDPVWDVPNLFVSPHISGDFIGYEADLVKLFRDNLDRYLNGEALYNLVDKRLGCDGLELQGILVANCCNEAFEVFGELLAFITQVDQHHRYWNNLA